MSEKKTNTRNRLPLLVGVVAVLLVGVYAASSWFVTPPSRPIVVVTTTAQTATGTGTGLPPGLPNPIHQNPAWFNFEFQDVVTGKTFRVSDFKGKVVVVEFMAIWCPLCKDQAAQLKAAKQSLGDQAVFISFDIDPNEKAEDLKRYALANNPTSLWALDRQGVGAQYNAQAPDTPILIIDPEGRVFGTTPGIKSSTFVVDFVRRVSK